MRKAARSIEVKGGQQNNFLPCFLCGAKLEKRTDKNLKPYFICNPCGIQLFVRRQHGIERLDTLMRTLRRRKLPIRQPTNEFSKTRALLTELSGAEAQINLLKVKLENLSAEFNPSRD
jgi:recombinational DNA repair protein (RecF pathway)